MRFLALATDYDGTLAHHGEVDFTTVAALERLRDSGRKLILVTGRDLPDLLRVLPQPELFDRIVAENGALLYRPESREESVLVQPPPPQFIQLLRERGVKDLSSGHVIVSSQELYANAMLLSIRDLGLELQLTFNKGAVMALPSGVNKATGLQAALLPLGLSRHNVVGVGDAENDHAFLDVCGCSVAVANALPALKARADIVTQGDHGMGVSELINDLIATDLASLGGRPGRHDLILGEERPGKELRIPAGGSTILVAGSSGGGKSTLVNGFIERLLASDYQALIIDPEGDYPEIDGTLVLGTAKQAPSREEIMGALEKPTRTVVTNLISIPLEDRPAFLQALLLRMQEMRVRTGRPHWIILDEAHHVFPHQGKKPAVEIPGPLHSLIFVTVDPEHVHRSALHRVEMLLVVGKNPRTTIEHFCASTGKLVPTIPHDDLTHGEGLAWRPGSPPVAFNIPSTKTNRRRHVRKYARGELSEQDSFYFEGPEKKLRLRAQNLQNFLQLGDGVDDGTWEHHLRKGEYSQWMRRVLKDEELADAVTLIEQSSSLSAQESRRSIRAEVESRYTAPE